MTITTVLHSPYTPGRPRAARPGPVSQSRPRLAIPAPARPGPARSENKTREPGPGMSCSALDCDPGPVSQSRSRAEWIARLGPTGRAVTGLPGSPGPVRADIPDNNVMVSSLSPLSTSRNNVIISPDPTQVIRTAHQITFNPL